MAVRSGADSLLEHRPFVVRLCRILLRDADESEDAAQQVFLHAYRAMSNGARPRKTRSWLAQIARNECRSRMRHAAAHPHAALHEGLLADTADPADAAAANALVAELQAELADLPPRQREALLLREIRGLSYRELAATMDETAPAVESLLHRGRRTLLQRLVGPAFAFEWLRNLFARLVPPGGTAEVATAGGAALVVAKLAAVTAVSVGTPAVHVAQKPTAPVAQISEVRVVHRPAQPHPPRTAPVRRARHVLTRGHSGHSSGSGHRDEPAASKTTNSGPGSASSPEPEAEVPAPAPVSAVAPDNSGPGSTTVSFEEPSRSDNSGRGSPSSGHHDGQPEPDHSGPG